MIEMICTNCGEKHFIRLYGEKVVRQRKTESCLSCRLNIKPRKENDNGSLQVQTVQQSNNVPDWS